MSEKQAKRRDHVDVTPKPRKKSSWGINLIMTIIVIAAVVAATFTVRDAYKKKHPFIPTTVADFAKQSNLSTEEFMKKWGLEGKEGVSGETNMLEAQQQMPVSKYVEYMGQTYEAYLEENGLSSQMPPETTVAESNNWVKVSKIAEGNGMDYAAFIEFYGLTAEELPEDMPFKDAQAILVEAEGKVPLSKMLEMYQMTYEDFLAQTGLTEEQVTPDTPWKDVQTEMDAVAETTGTTEAAE